MKNLKFLTPIAFMSITSMALAQIGGTDNREETQLELRGEDEREEIQFGLKAGLNYSNVYDERSDDFRADSKFGFAGGLVLILPITKFLGVQPELLFSQKGFKGEGTLLGNTYNLNRTTTYIDVPLQIALKPTKSVSIVAGPQYSYLIKQKDVFTSTLVSNTQEQVFKTDNIRKNIFGFIGGLDIKMEAFLLGTRVGWDIQNNNGNGSSSTPRYKNVWFQATAGYIFQD